VLSSYPTDETAQARSPEFQGHPPAEQLRASREFVDRMSARRSVPFMSAEPVPFELIENAIRRASLAPSGANQQPWKSSW
jgi:hypothetical protein